MASAREFQITFDCADPEPLARFWCAVLGYELSGSGADWAACTDPGGVGPRLLFLVVPEGKTAKNRVHLDVRAGKGLVGEARLRTLLGERDRLMALGASEVLLQEADEENESCITMRDIEGNEFCLD